MIKKLSKDELLELQVYNVQRFYDCYLQDKTLDQLGILKCSAIDLLEAITEKEKELELEEE